MSNLAEHTCSLESLIFNSQHACKVASSAPVGDPQSAKILQDAETSLLQLQSMLGYLAAASENEENHCQPLLSDCLARLTRLGINYTQTSARYAF